MGAGYWRHAHESVSRIHYAFHLANDDYCTCEDDSVIIRCMPAGRKLETFGLTENYGHENDGP